MSAAHNISLEDAAVAGPTVKIDELGHMMQLDNTLPTSQQQWQGQGDTPGGGQQQRQWQDPWLPSSAATAPPSLSADIADRLSSVERIGGWSEEPGAGGALSWGPGPGGQPMPRGSGSGVGPAVVAGAGRRRRLGRKGGGGGAGGPARSLRTVRRSRRGAQPLGSAER